MTPELLQRFYVKQIQSLKNSYQNFYMEKIGASDTAVSDKKNGEVWWVTQKSYDLSNTYELSTYKYPEKLRVTYLVYR